MRDLCVYFKQYVTGVSVINVEIEIIMWMLWYVSNVKFNK
jgi:hypothetical protein